MLKEKILPADTFIVINKTTLNDNDRKILTMLYQPIIGSLSINLFFTLWSYLDKLELMSIEITHHQLMSSMGSRLDEICIAREKLEAVGLIRTYIKKDNINNIVYELYSPLNAYEFFNNPMLSICLYNNVGKVEFELLKEYYKNPHLNLNEYEDISCSFSDVFEVVNTNDFEIFNDMKRVNVNKLSIASKLNFDNTISLIPDDLLNVRSITKDIKDLIYKLSYIYNLDDERMSSLIWNSLTSKKTIDKEKLKENARNFYKFENSGKLPSLAYKNQPEYLRKEIKESSNKNKMIYQFETTSPYDFLVNKHNGKIGEIVKLNKNECSILEYLLIDMHFNPGVVNVMLDYVLKTNNNKLIKNYIELIAEQWSRNKIETVEAAMNLAEAEYKKSIKTRKTSKKLENEPKWFNKKVEEVEASKEEIDEINELLSEYE